MKDGAAAIPLPRTRRRSEPPGVPNSTPRRRWRTAALPRPTVTLDRRATPSRTLQIMRTASTGDAVLPRNDNNPNPKALLSRFLDRLQQRGANIPTLEP